MGSALVQPAVHTSWLVSSGRSRYKNLRIFLTNSPVHSDPLKPVRSCTTSSDNNPAVCKKNQTTKYIWTYI